MTQVTTLSLDQADADFMRENDISPTTFLREQLRAYKKNIEENSSRAEIERLNILLEKSAQIESRFWHFIDECGLKEKYADWRKNSKEP